MRYINKLELDIKNLQTQMTEADEVIVELYKYLQLEKFHNDKMVNVQDIFNRLAPIRNILNFDGKMF